jgi:signal transduction histidine kinase
MTVTPSKASAPANLEPNAAASDAQALRDLAQKIEELIYFPDKIEKPARIDEIWEGFSQEINHHIDTEVCALFRVNDHTHEFELSHWRPDDVDESCQREIDAQIECGMFAWIINRRLPAIIPSLVFKNHKTLIMLPLTTQAQTLGLVMVVTPIHENAITHERLKLLAILAKQCALIMENALLYAQLQNEHASLQKAQHRIIQAEKFAAFGRMTSGAFHEFLNPLNILSSHLQLMQMSALPAEQVQAYAALMDSQTKRMADMVKSLQRFSAPRKRRSEVLIITPLVYESLDAVQARHPDRKISFEMVIDTDSPLVDVNREDFMTVLAHMLDNAFDAIADSGTIRIQVGQEIPGDAPSSIGPMVVCRLSDDGGGISSDNLAKIFDPFFTTKEIGKGTGLNLSICYALIQSMGGTITARSEVGAGATFSIYLPAAV